MSEAKPFQLIDSFAKPMLDLLLPNSNFVMNIYFYGRSVMFYFFLICAVIIEILIIIYTTRWWKRLVAYQSGKQIPVTSKDVQFLGATGKKYPHLPGFSIFDLLFH
jgi:hypothetical protein